MLVFRRNMTELAVSITNSFTFIVHKSIDKNRQKSFKLTWKGYVKYPTLVAFLKSLDFICWLIFACSFFSIIVSHKEICILTNSN
jgi:hypothetical protein